MAGHLAPSLCPLVSAHPDSSGDLVCADNPPPNGIAPPRTQGGIHTSTLSTLLAHLVYWQSGRQNFLLPEEWCNSQTFPEPDRGAIDRLFRGAASGALACRPAVLCEKIRPFAHRFCRDRNRCYREKSGVGWR